MEQMRFLRDMGAEATMVSGGGIEDNETYESALKRLAEQCDELWDFGNKIGVRPGHHNHMGALVETEEQITNFLDNTKIGFCPDVGHLVGAGCDDPLEVIKKYSKRITCGHLKDVVFDEEGRFSRFIEIGSGSANIPFKEILNFLDSTGFDGYFSVEQDNWSFSPAADAAKSRKFLRSIGY